MASLVYLRSGRVLFEDPRSDQLTLKPREPVPSQVGHPHLRLHKIQGMVIKSILSLFVKGPHIAVLVSSNYA